MRLLLITLLATAGCNRPVQYVDRVVHDTVKVEAVARQNIAGVPGAEQNISLNDSSAVCDSAGMRLRAANFKLARIRYYVDICNKNPRQDKFLKGWINRVMQ